MNKPLTHPLAAEATSSSRRYPLTLAQKRIWALGQIGNATVFPNQMIALRWAVGIDIDQITRALTKLTRRHAALRTRFERLAGGRIECFSDFDEVPSIEVVTDVVEAAEAPALVQQFAARGFDLLREPASRSLAFLDSNGRVCSVTALHAIVCDVAASQILRQNLIQIVAGNKKGEADDLLLTAGQQELNWLDSEACSEATAYWRGLIGDDYLATTLPTRFNASGFAGAERRRIAFSIPANVWAATQFWAAKHGIAEEAALAAAFAAVLVRCSGSTTLQIGFLSGQPTSEAGVRRSEQIVPLKQMLATHQTMTGLCTAIAAARADAALNAAPYEHIVAAIQTHAERAQEAIVKSLFEYRAMTVASEAAEDLLPQMGARADVEFAFVVQPNAEGGLDGLIDYADDLYDHRLVARAATHFERALSQMTARPDLRIKDIELVSADELDSLSAPYEDNEVNDDRAVHQHISAHAARNPDKTAIIFADEVWSHGKLEREANQLAHRLIALGVGAEITVAIAIKRSPQAIVAILATLKAGGAYIPVEPDHPQTRNHHILRDGGVKVILTNSWLLDRIPDGLDATVLELDQLELSREPTHAPDVPIHKDQLAYVMYTSGSTGLPKGVAVEHGPLTHHMQNTSRVYGMSSESRELPFLPFSSDGGHERWMNPLMEGGSIILPDQPLWTPEETLTAMRKHGANNASIPTTYLQQLAEWADLTDGAPPMRLYSFGGEALPQQTFELLSRALKSKTLINGYGPTETIMTPLVWRVQAGETFEGTYAPIGRPVGNRRCYVLDPDLNPCPIGVTGELYIGGEGIARGYVGKPDVTADRFIPDPFSKEGGRLYRSGDLTRWRDDGTVEFVGRVDHQVKLRGYRIELGEIETALLDHPSVGEALVVLREDDATREKMLVAYVVPKQGFEIDAADVHASLERALPAYMVPSAIMPLVAMPINPNSKLDRFALPAPKPVQRAIVAPANAREEEMIEIWRQVLKLDAISVDDNFFAIGGNSLGAIRILSALRQHKPQNGTTIADLFNNPTIRSFAEVAETTRDKAGSEVIVLRASGDKPMLYCFPGLLVSTREYVKLVDYLGADHPATGFICHSLSENRQVGTTVEEVTQTYVDYIRRHSAGKPCYFLGWSWGGLLAYETARRLGNEIDLKLMAMIDVCDLGTEFALGAKPSFKPGEREALHAAVTDWLGRTKMRAEWDRLLGVMDAGTYDQFLRFVGDEKDPLPADGPDISSREHTFWILIDNALVFRHHKMKPFDAPIHSWAADDSLNRGLNLIDWRRYSPRANPAEIISGTNHLHVIGSQAFHGRLAQRLHEALDK